MEGENKSKFWWEDLKDEELLEVRLCDLGVRIEGTEIERYIQEFYKELDAKGLGFHPECYLADEWFTPDGEPIIGIPFFLSHPRLKKLEEKMFVEVEGGTKRSFMKLLRHEAGHAFNYAYLLYRRKRWKELFGPFSKEYSDHYIYRPYSKSYVRHLDDWYAQSHPDEDFAETFAAWLTPGQDWRKEYAGWKALEKLEYVDKLMKEIGKKTPIIKKGERYYEVSKLKMKLITYYKRKRAYYREDYPDFHDSDLKRIFSDDSHLTTEKASQFMRRYRKSILDNVDFWTGAKKFIINRLLQDLIDRADKLGLKVVYSEAETVIKLSTYITSLMMNYMMTGSFKRRRWRGS